LTTIDFDELATLELFDANCRIGPSDFTIGAAPVTAKDLSTEMERVHIHEALVYHASAASYSPARGNMQLCADIEGASHLQPCWVVMPHYTSEFHRPDELINRLGESGVRAVRMFPRSHRYSIAEWSAGELLAMLAERRIPLFLDFDRTHWAEEVVDYDGVSRICRLHPSLPVVLVREGIGSARYLYPLFDEYANFHIELSYYQAAGGIADIARQFGADRMLFGTGLPDYEAGPTITMLYFSEIPFSDKKMIAGDNLRRLLASSQM
jgi:hypothetical protein